MSFTLVEKLRESSKHAVDKNRTIFAIITDIFEILPKSFLSVRKGHTK